MGSEMCIRDSGCLSVSVCVCVTFVVFTDCESCTRPILINPGSTEADECGRTRGTCFLACRIEVVAMAGLLRISWCVLGAAGFLGDVLSFFFFERTRPAASMRPPCLIYLSTSTGCVQGACIQLVCLSVCLCVCVTFVVFNEARPRERSDRGCFLPLVRKNSSHGGAYRHTGVRTGYHYLISQSVRPSVCICQCVCVTFVALMRPSFAFKAKSLFMVGCVQGATI